MRNSDILYCREFWKCSLCSWLATCPKWSLGILWCNNMKALFLSSLFFWVSLGMVVQFSHRLLHSQSYSSLLKVDFVSSNSGSCLIYISLVTLICHFRHVLMVSFSQIFPYWSNSNEHVWSSLVVYARLA